MRDRTALGDAAIERMESRSSTAGERAVEERRRMKIYTRKGDRGQTSMLGGGRVPKSDPRIRALGALDELNARLGGIAAQPSVPPEIHPILLRVQSVLLEAGAALASSDPEPWSALLAAETAALEAEIDRMERDLPPLTRFILPGGSSTGAALHEARAIARRAESQAVEACGGDESRVPLLTWLNRLSDALFVLARTANRLAGADDVPWESRTGKEET
jgi:cob(I)alamin adenosyltransferase